MQTFREFTPHLNPLPFEGRSEGGVPVATFASKFATDFSSQKEERGSEELTLI
jgi:hypothetical protein